MQENNGRGIFYGVIGVATLVVAIIGATFAFFASTANSADDAVNTGSADVQQLTIDVDSTGVKSALIPMLEANANFAATIGKADSKCVDDRNQNICSVQTFTVTNPSDIDQDVTFTLKPSTNGFENLHYVIYKGTPADGSYGAVTVAPVADAGATTAAGTIVEASGADGLDGTSVVNLTNISQSIPASGSVSYTIVFWIHETGNSQPGDVNKTFAAGITAFSGTAGTGVTGVLAAGA